jgi:hypothetical protein
LYTSCMLRGAFYAFYKILYLSKKKVPTIDGIAPAFALH